jgi:transcriptional regulator NrdR family protein
MNIIKRDGTIVPFNKEKIVSAVNQAFISVIGDVYDDEEKVSQSIANDIEKTISDNTSVE